MLPTKETELATIAPIGLVSEPPRAKYERLIVTAKEAPPATTVVVHPCDETSLRAPSTPPRPASSNPFWSGPQ